MNIEISASLRKEIQKTFAFIIDEGRRLQAVLLEYKTSRVRPSQTDGFDLFFCFGNNTSNRFPVGKAALTRFNALCERIVIDIGVSNQLSADIFSQVFANEFLKTSSEDTADNFDLRIDECIKKSLVESLPKTEASVHYLPINCEFKDGPEQFAIGSYTLHKGKQFAAQLPQVLSSDSHLGEDELSNLVNYYSKFGTVVEIPLHAADGEKSRELAEAVASNIGNILTLLVEHSTAVNYRVGGAEPNFSTAYNIVKVANSHQFGWSQKHEAAMPVEGWWDSFETEQREEIFAFFGRAIHYGILTEPKCAISRRFLESLKWFAEGIVDKMPESKLVKFTVAIEFLVCSGIPEPEQVATGKIKSKFVSRSRALAFLSGFCPEPPNYLNYGQLYDQRSDIVHGRHIQQERQRWQTAHRSEMHARWAIMGALYFFGRNNAFGSSKLSEVQTSKVFDDLIKWYNETKKMGA